MLDWSKPDHVAEVYNFLNELTEPLPLAVSTNLVCSVSCLIHVGSIQVSRLRLSR